MILVIKNNNTTWQNILLTFVYISNSKLRIPPNNRGGIGGGDDAEGGHGVGGEYDGVGDGDGGGGNDDANGDDDHGGGNDGDGDDDDDSDGGGNADGDANDGDKYGHRLKDTQANAST